MGKRQELRDQRRKQQRRNRLIVIAVVSIAGLLLAFLLIKQITKPLETGSITQITLDPRKIQVDASSLGNPDAKVKMDVWEDFQCSGCRAYTDSIEPDILTTYVESGKVFYTFHFYPFIDGGAGESHDSANAAMCASAQNHFWDYHDILFANWLGENVGSFTTVRLKAFAQSINLDMTAFNKCFQDNTYLTHIQQDVQAGTSLGVPPTPGIFVDGKMVVSSAGANYIPSGEDISKVLDASIAGE